MERTIFLLKYISDVKLREVIHRTTNKVEQYNNFEDWITFALSGGMIDNVYVEQEKRVKYTDLIANCIMLDNTLEISVALNTLASEGRVPTVDQLAALSPYQTRHIKRFGDYSLDLTAIAEPVMDDLTFEIEPPQHLTTVEANVPALPAASSA